jgi:hypothetical protein
LGNLGLDIIHKGITGPAASESDGANWGVSQIHDHGSSTPERVEADFMRVETEGLVADYGSGHLQFGE